MKRIFKYALSPASDRIYVRMPFGASILCVQTQHGEPFLWAIVDDEMPELPVLFRVFRTGDEFDLEEAHTYVGTFQTENSALVFHVFTIN